MTRLAQVPHVMWKDARQARWPLAAYAAVVALSWAQALELPIVFMEAYDFSMFLVVLAGMYIAGLFIHADSPTRDDSYWATRPLDPAAVLAAKGALAFVALIIPPLIAQLHVLIVSEVPSTSIAWMLGRSIWLYAIWLVVAMVIAGMTRDVRSFTLGMLMVPVAFLLLGIVGSFFLTPGEASPATPLMIVATTSIGVIGLALAAKMLLALYQTRALRWHGRALSVVAMVGSVYAMGARLPGRPARENVAASIRDGSVSVEVLGPGNRPGVSIWVPSVATSDRLIVLQSGDVVFRMRNGSTLRAPIPTETLVLALPSIPIRGVRWLGARPFAANSSRWMLNLTRSQEDLLRTGVESAEFDGYVAAFEPGVAFALPYREGATQTRYGNSALVMAATPERDDSVATLALSILDDPDTLTWRPRFGMQLEDGRYSLVNEKRREAIVLQEGGTTGKSEALVLPGAWRTSTTANVRLRENSRDSIPDGWASNAKIVMLDWVRRGRSHARVKVGVRQRGDGT